MPTLPEQLARQQIDALLSSAGWAVQDYTAYAPTAASQASGGCAFSRTPSARATFNTVSNRGFAPGASALHVKS